MDKECSSGKLSDYNYYLPKNLIAQQPLKTRTACRLLLVDRKKDNFSQSSFPDLLSALRPGDLLVLNNSKVIPARLLGKKKNSGGAIEVFLHKKVSSYSKQEVWEVLIKGRAQKEVVIIFAKNFSAEVILKNEDGSYLVIFNQTGANFWKALDRYGQVPLPPYIKREKSPGVNDKLYYQTVFADDKKAGSVAAPTAGLHFTKDFLKKIKEKGVEIVEITLHVGLGTFSPIRTEIIADHKMHEELVMIENSVARKLIKQKKSGQRIVAVGTTTCRALEAWGQRGGLEKKDFLDNDIFSTDIFISPGYKFLLTDALLTNFHLPKSSLLILVSALAGRDKILSAYNFAVEENFRFFSYGDAMLIS